MVPTVVRPRLSGRTSIRPRVGSDRRHKTTLDPGPDGREDSPGSPASGRKTHPHHLPPSPPGDDNPPSATPSLSRGARYRPSILHETVNSGGTGPCQLVGLVTRTRP